MKNNQLRLMVYPAMAAALVLLIPAAGALAQNAANSGQDETHVKLTKTVHLALGATTVASVMAALSEQTGVTIKPAEYLRERRLDVQMDGVSASAALDALAELNDWTWYPTLPNQILVARRRLRMDSIPAAVPRMMQAAIPKDIRTFLHILTPSEDLSKHVNIYNSDLRNSINTVRKRIYRTVADDERSLLTSLAPGILGGEVTPYVRLTTKQCRELLVTLVFPLFENTGYELLHGDIPPHVVDVNSAVLELSDGNTLLIGSEFIDGDLKTGVGFGAAIR